MNKKKIVIASILKPLRDPRHYERLALSLAKTNKYEVNIIANGEKKPNLSNIRFYSNGLPGRQLLHRFRLQWSTFIHSIRTKPDLFIVCTVELLPFAILYSILTGCKLIYDIQENYTLNFKHLKEYDWRHRILLAPMVTGVEHLSRKFTDHYFLAEKCYEHQLNFINSKFTVLENKTVLESPKNRIKSISKSKTKFLFSGTISAYSGIYKIFDLIHQFRLSKIDFEFTIIGQVLDEKIWTEIQNIEAPNIHLIIAKQPVSHDQIIQEILAADIGVISYQSQPVNEYKIPTKLYEYASYDLPFLVEKDSHWFKVGSQLGRAIPFDFNTISIELLTKSIQSIGIESGEKSGHLALWKTEEDKLIRSIDTLLK